MLRAPWVFVVVMGVFACDSEEPATLVVDVVTDYAPGIEFALIHVEVVGGAQDELPATATDEDIAGFLRGRRALEAEVPRGVVELRVELLRIDRTVVATRRQRITVRGNTGTIVVVSRLCEGISCPGAEDAAEATECAYGRCVPPECAPDDVEICNAGEPGRPIYGCTEDAECEVASLASCARFRCLEAVCVVERDHGTCASEEYCDITEGCTALPDVTLDGGMIDGGGPDAAIEGPPVECREGGSMGPPDVVPGGTLECPEDKNLAGCPCPTAGTTAPCWPGLRINRSYGICRDGSTTCGDDNRWGACGGAVLPNPGELFGDGSCRCFSAGRWELDRISTCSYASGATIWATSTMAGTMCPPRTPPPPVPSSPWSENRLTVDCTGSFELCFMIKAGDYDAPGAEDCTVGGSCVQVWIDTPGTTQELPPLPAWLGEDTACAENFRDTGGYGEMTVHGLSLACDEIGTAVTPYVFNRMKYCAAGCTSGVDPGCDDCAAGSSGMF